jgi:hypothetical protein
MGFDDFEDGFNWINGRRALKADHAKRLADRSPIEASQAANQAAFTLILTAIQTASMAGAYFINVDTTTLTGADYPYLVNQLHAKWGYTVQTIGTNMNIDWSNGGYGKVGRKRRFWNWWEND